MDNNPVAGWFDVEEVSPRHHRPQALFPSVSRSDPGAASQQQREETATALPSSSSALSSSLHLKDYLLNLVARVEERGGSSAGNRRNKGDNGDEDDDCGPLFASELTELGLQSSRDEAAFDEVDTETLATISQWLYEHVLEAATSASMIDQVGAFLADDAAPSQAMTGLHQWFRSKATRNIRILKRGMEAASILLRWAASKSIDQRVVHEDALNATVSLFRLHLTQHVIPSWNQSGTTNKSSNASYATTVVETGVAESPKKRRRITPTTPISTTASKEWKKLYKMLLSTLPTFIVLMERLEGILRSTRVSLDHQPLLMLTNAATASLEMDCQIPSSHNSPTNMTPLGVPVAWGAQIQVASIDLLTAVFAKYMTHQETILEDFLGLLLKFPSGKRSLRAFTVRYTSALHHQDLARRNEKWVGKLLQKTYPMDGQTPHRIQMMTALILQLLHTSVTRPNYETVDATDEQGNTTPKVRLRSGLVQCQRVAEYLAAAFLSRCSRKEVSGSPSEYRPILSHLVDDLLMVLLIPEYPAAEVMLSAIVRRLIGDLQRASQSKAEATYLNLAFDILGKVFAVEARLLAQHRASPIRSRLGASLPRPKSNMVVCGQHIAMGCFCKKNFEDATVVECDDCGYAWHGSCVGITSLTVPDEWICDGCRLGRIVTRERLRFGNNQDIPDLIDDVYAMRQSFLASLSHRNGVAGLEPAISFHMARWAEELEAKHAEKARAATRVIVHGILDYWEEGFTNSIPVGEALTEEGAARVMLSLLAQTSTLLLSFRNQMSFLVKLLSDPVGPTIRKLTVKAIERTVEGDFELMTIKMITQSISRRLLDDAIAVREATLSLVGSIVVQFPEVTRGYHDSLLTCLSDVGVSVRKKAVKIFLDILTANPRYKQRAEVFDVLLQRAADKKEEDSVRDLIYGMLVKVWMENGELILPLSSGSLESSPAGPPSSSASPEEEEVEGANVVTPTPTSPRRTLRRRADIAAEQMMEVVRTSGTTANLEAVLKKLMTSSAQAKQVPSGLESKRELKRARPNQSDRLVNALVDILLSMDERRGIRFGQNLTAVLQTLVVFADVSPSSLYCHLDTLIPYLKADNGVSTEDESLVVAAVCDILSRVSVIFRMEDVHRMYKLKIADDFRQICYKFGASALASAICAFSSLAHHEQTTENDDFSTELLKMSRTFYKSLVNKSKGIPNFSKDPDKRTRSNTQRALSVLGLICQHHSSSNSTAEDSDGDEDSSKIEDARLISHTELDWGNMNRECFRVFVLYFKNSDSVVQTAALRALGGVFMVQPRLMMRLAENNFIKEVLSPAGDITLQLEAMLSWRNILIAEEKRVDGGYAKQKMEQDENITVSKRIAGDQDGDSNIFGGILTSDARSIYQLTKSTDSHVRFATVELLEVIMRQGLVNPNEAVPHLFALQGDVDNPAIRSLACNLLMAEGEKRPDILRQRICAGVRQAFDFQHILRRGERVSALLPATSPNPGAYECIFDVVFRECIAKKKIQKHLMLTSLLNLFDLKDLQAHNTKKPKANDITRDVTLLGFTAEILAHLPYTAASDPLRIIREIRFKLSLQGEQVIDLLANILRPVGLASEDVYDDRNASEDALERASKSKFPSKTPDAAALTKQNFNMPEFLRLCDAAMAMTFLLRLKVFLRTLYNLSEARCLEFDPNDKEKPSDKSLSKSEVKYSFDAKVYNKADLDSVIRQYAEFRRLMREENTVLSANTADSDLDDHRDEGMATESATTENETNECLRKRKSSFSAGTN